MCTSNPTPKTDIPFTVKGRVVKSGETWWINERPFIIEQTGMKYHDSNGDPDTLYLAMHDEQTRPFIKTHKAFANAAEPEQKLQEKFVTMRQLLILGPCNDGLHFIASFLKLSPLHTYPESQWPYVISSAVFSGTVGNQAFSTRKLHSHFVVTHGQRTPPDSWLLFVAKAINQVPKESSGPDRATLLRLLGIKE